MTEESGQERPINTIPVQEVSSCDEGDPTVIRMFNVFGRTQGGLEDRVREIAENRAWWRKKEWREKTAQEQFDFQINGAIFSVYNYGPLVSRQEIAALERTINTYAHIQGGRALRFAKCIVINNEERREIGKLRGGRQYGRTHQGSTDLKRDGITGHVVAASDPTCVSFIEINPFARANPQARYAGLPGVTPFEGTLVHEFAHILEHDISVDWRDQMGWREKEGQRAAFAEDSRPPTRYGELGYDEDFAESMTCFLRHPSFMDHLRQSGTHAQQLAWDMRQKFLKSRFGPPPKIEKSRVVLAIRKTGAEIQLPKLPETLYYTRIQDAPQRDTPPRKLPDTKEAEAIKAIRGAIARQEHARRDAVREPRQRSDGASTKQSPPQTTIQKFFSILRKVFIGETTQEKNERFKRLHEEAQAAKKKRGKKK